MANAGCCLPTCFGPCLQYGPLIGTQKHAYFANSACILIVEFAVAGWVGLELFIARPLQRDLGLDCGYPIGRVEKCLFLWP